jgi:hypothetical protein
LAYLAEALWDKVKELLMEDGIIIILEMAVEAQLGLGYLQEILQKLATEVQELDNLQFGQMQLQQAQVQAEEQVDCIMQEAEEEDFLFITDHHIEHVTVV